MYTGVMHRIYLDYAASAPLSPESKAVIGDFSQKFTAGNPSSLHTEGRKAQAKLDRAVTTVAAIFGAQPTEVLLSSGATESNNTIIRGVLDAWAKQHPDTPPHVVLTAVEHASWRQSIQAILPHADITTVPVNHQGRVDAHTVLQAIRPNTALVGCMYVQNEIGVIQPIEEIGKGVEQLRDKHNSQWPVFHVDAVQAFPYLNTHMGHMHADSVTFSGHKYGSLGGIGVLIIKQGTPWLPTLRGGNQQWSKRAGTENILGAMTLAATLEYADTNRDELTQHARSLQKLLERELKRRLPDVTILGSSEARSPHISYLWLPNLTDEHVVQKLDLAGVAVSSGSACSSGAQLPSATLLAMGYSPKESYGGIRVSFGRHTTPVEIETFVDALETCIVKA